MDPERRHRIKRNFEQLVGKAGSDDQAFRSALSFLREHMVLPSYATFAGLPVTVANIEYHGSPRLGITAVVLRRNRRYRVCLLDLEFSPELAISDCQEAYRSWVGWPTTAAHEDRRWSRDQFGIDDARILRDREQQSDEAIARGNAEGALVGAGLAGLSDGRTTAELVVFSVGNRIAACRCLDAYAHLGNLYIDRQTDKALRLYRAALDMAALSFPPGFNGVLPWGHLDNRPYLRCLHGCGLCLWRLGYFDEAGEMFERMLWLNPVDNQGARFLIAEVREKRPWRPDL